ncbi:MAG: flavodoxin [Eubacteriales bacterium]|nr:flavodoxin [Lachnospiraceae bacterium]MDO5126161.1 flavodoxin [Eubacteriales bacterium]
MKTAIVYYSMSGNTELVANKVAAYLGERNEVDVIRIIPKKAYPEKGFLKFFWGGKSAVMAEKPKLLPYEFNQDKYDRIIIGTPVWASTFAPPIRSFIDAHPGIKDKKLAAFLCYSGGGADKTFEKLKATIGVGEFEAELVLLDPKEKVSEENDDKIKHFCDIIG